MVCKLVAKQVRGKEEVFEVVWCSHSYLSSPHPGPEGQFLVSVSLHPVEQSGG